MNKVSSKSKIPKKSHFPPTVLYVYKGAENSKIFSITHGRAPIFVPLCSSKKEQRAPQTAFFTLEVENRVPFSVA